MDVSGGKIIFGKGELTRFRGTVANTAHEDVADIAPRTVEVDPETSEMVVRALHGVANDPSLRAERRESAADQLAQIGVLGLRDSAAEATHFNDYRIAVSTASALG